MNLKTFVLLRSLNVSQPLNNIMSVLPLRQIRGTIFIIVSEKSL